jgi:hypothetical protein
MQFFRRVAAHVLQVYIICTLLLSFLPVNYFCPRFSSSSSNNKKHCSYGNNFFVSGTYIQNKNPRHAEKNSALTIKEIAKGEVDGLDVAKQYELDRAHPPKPESVRDKNGQPYYNAQSVYVDGFPKTKKLVEAAAKMFPHYQLSPNKYLGSQIQHVTHASNLAKFSEDPSVYGMRGARLRGAVPDNGLKPLQYMSDSNDAGPGLLYQQYSTDEYDQKLTDVSDPVQNARISKSSVIQDPITQRHYNVETLSGAAFMSGGTPPKGAGRSVSAGRSSSSSSSSSGSTTSSAANAQGSNPELKLKGTAAFNTPNSNSADEDKHQKSALEHNKNADINEEKAEDLDKQAASLQGDEKSMVLSQAKAYRQSATQEREIAKIEDQQIPQDDSDGEEETVESRVEQQEQQQQQSGQPRIGDPQQPCKSNVPGTCIQPSECRSSGGTLRSGYCNGGSDNVCCDKNSAANDVPTQTQQRGNGNCPGKSKWSAVLSSSGITLNNFHPSGVRDNADPKKQVEAAAQGHEAERSSYGTAPGGSTCLSTRLADFLLKLGQQYGGVTVNSIAGADHSRGSSHYRGTTIDVGALKGRRLDDAEMAQLVVNTCVLDMGGRAISNPGGRKIQNTVNYGGHRTWVHCSLRL